VQPDRSSATSILADALEAIDVEFLGRVATYQKPEVIFVKLVRDHLRAAYPDIATGGRYPVAADGRSGMADLSAGDLRWEMKSSVAFDHRNAERETWLVKNEIAKDNARLQAYAASGPGRVGVFAWLVYFETNQYGPCPVCSTTDECFDRWVGVITRQYKAPHASRRGPFGLFQLEWI
jgi:hypothetical protein